MIGGRGGCGLGSIRLAKSENPKTRRGSEDGLSWVYYDYLAIVNIITFSIVAIVSTVTIINDVTTIITILILVVFMEIDSMPGRRSDEQAHPGERNSKLHGSI